MRFSGQVRDREAEVRTAAPPQTAGQQTASWSKGAGRESRARAADVLDADRGAVCARQDHPRSGLSRGPATH